MFAAVATFSAVGGIALVTVIGEFIGGFLVLRSADQIVQFAYR